jgi:hypothetical protein
MIYKLPSTQPGAVRVVFELPSCVWADRIFVTGSFNDWDRTSLPMAQDRDGVWRATLELPAGHRFQFRYLLDGRWQTDYHADGFTDNQYGTHNSIVDLSLVVTLPINTRLSSQVSDGHVAVPPHLPAPAEISASGPRNRARNAVEMPRMRPRVAAA